jgi:hypothetical protein
MSLLKYPRMFIPDDVCKYVLLDFLKPIFSNCLICRKHIKIAFDNDDKYCKDHNNELCKFLVENCENDWSQLSIRSHERMCKMKKITCRDKYKSICDENNIYPVLFAFFWFT